MSTHNSVLPAGYIDAFEQHQRAVEHAATIAKTVDDTGIGDERLYEANRLAHEASDRLEAIRARLGLTAL